MQTNKANNTKNFGRKTFKSQEPKQAQAETVQLLDRRQSVVYNVPVGRIVYAPETKRLVLCERFDPADEFACRFGATANCRFVHADIRGMTPSDIHVAYAYPTPDACIYPRHEAPEGVFYPIREPASAKSFVVDEVLPCLVLKTRCVFNNSKRPAFRCAHFYYGRECHLGSKCDFAHVIHINPNAQEGDKAPLPSQFGRGRDRTDDNAPFMHQMKSRNGGPAAHNNGTRGNNGHADAQRKAAAAALQEQYHQHMMPTDSFSNSAPLEFSDQYYAARAKYAGGNSRHHTGNNSPYNGGFNHSNGTPTHDYLPASAYAGCPETNGIHSGDISPADPCLPSSGNDHSQSPYDHSLDYDATQGGGNYAMNNNMISAASTPGGPHAVYPTQAEEEGCYHDFNGGGEYDGSYGAGYGQQQGPYQSPAPMGGNQARWQYNPYGNNSAHQGAY